MSLREAFARLFRGGRPIVTLLRLSGPIMAGGRTRSGISYADTLGRIETAFAVPGVKAVALVINSPGGSPVQSGLILDRIRALADEKNVPVLAFVEDIAASGGYMLALAGDEIFAHPASIVGSIGVVSGGFGFPEALKKLGIERRLYTAGDNKARLDPFSPEKPEDVDWLKGLQGQIHDYFRKTVEDRRGRRLKTDTDGLYSGEVWLGAHAQDIGLIDGIGEARAMLQKRFGRKLRIRTITPRKGLLSGLLPMGGRGAHVDGHAITENLDRNWAGDLLASIEERLLWNRWGL